MARRTPAGAVVRRGQRRLAAGLAAIAAAAVALIVYADAVRPPPAAAARGGPFELVDQDGRTVTEASYRGKWLLVYFGYTRCPDACPTALNDIAEALDAVGPLQPKIQPLFITVDSTDTPDLLKPYTAAFSASLVGLTGSEQQIASAAKAFHVSYRRERAGNGALSIDHSSETVLIDPSGRLVARFPLETSVEAMTAKLKAAVS